MLSFKEFIQAPIVKEAIELNMERNIPLEECVFRHGSEKFFEYFRELRELYGQNLISEDFLSEDLLDLLDSDLGEFDLYEDQVVPLDFIFEEEGKQLNKIHRGGSKKFYVFVRDPSTKNVRKVSFGDTTGLSTKYNSPERKKAFAARHKCSEKKDKTKAGYWACRVNKQLGKSSAARSGYW